MSVKDFVQQRRDDFIAMRRDFHMYPEPAWLEYRSAAKVAEKLISRSGKSERCDGTVRREV